MSVYHGTVIGNTVKLPKEVVLTDGLRVEIRVPSAPSSPPRGTLTTEEQFQQRLLTLGLITEIHRPSPTVPLIAPVLVQVKGKPLSEMIIEERR
jgi:hypothetical protein